MRLSPPLRLAALLLALAATAAPAPAQTDSDGDGVSNSLEQSGYRFDTTSGDVVACSPATDDPCYVTDPLAWSSDGDPYSDFQEASGVNMDATVAVPYNSPLVAAYPVIEVWLNQYTFTSNAEITDSNGKTLSSGESFTSSVESTESVSVTVGASAGTDGLGTSAEATASYSETKAYGSEVTTGEEINWETATSTDLDDAGTLSLSLFARNTGGATALNVRPTFNVYIGDDLVATVLPDAPFRLSLAPGESSVPVVPVVGGAPLGLTLTFDRLQALQTGAPVTIEVVDIEADIQRWRPEDSNWACGTGETCTWTSFQNQILPRTLRLLVDFGYSGDPDADVPFQFRGNPYEYRVYTGSPNASPDITLGDVLRLADFDVTGSGGSLAIEGRSYPSAWVLAEQPDTGGFRPIEQNWQAAGEPQSLIDVVMPRQATLYMTSPDPVNPGAAIRATTVTRDFLNVRAVASPRGGLPIVKAEARLAQNGTTVTVPLQLANNGAYWTSEGSDIALDHPIGLASSSVEFTDLAGATQRSTGLGLPVQQAASCAEVPPGDLVDVVGDGGRATIFPDGDLDAPIEVYCERGSTTTRYWVPQTTPAGTRDVGSVVALDSRTAVAVGDGFVLRTEDGGRTWTQASTVPAISWWGLAHRPGTETLVAVGLQGERGGRIMRSTDGGRTWTQISGSFSRFYSVDYAGGDVWYARGGEGAITTPRLYRSTDDGRTWAPVSSVGSLRGLGTVAFSDASTGVVTDFGEGAAGSGGRLIRTTDGGQTWLSVLDQSRVFAVVDAGDRTWFALTGNFFDATDAALLRSTANGAPGTWETVSLLGTGAEYPRDIAFRTPLEGYMTDREGILKTSDGGDTWTFEPTIPRLSGALSRASASQIAIFDVNRSVIVGEAGAVLLSTSGGTGTVAVGNEDGAPDAPPSRVVLEPNAPNPFREHTTLTVRIDAPSDVLLTVHDLLGREVARLLDGPLTAGEHTARFDASRLASGLYVARLRAGPEVATRRMAVVR